MTDVWSHRALLGLYNITPLHYGVGQTTGAIDLPIARESTTGFPILPATGIKGILRDYAGEALGEKRLKILFGADIAAERASDGGAAAAGLLSFTEGRLLAWPARSLNRPFLHVTCPLILSRLRRDLRAAGAEALLKLSETPDGALAIVADETLGGGTLVLDNLVYRADETRFAGEAFAIAQTVATLIPQAEPDTRRQLESGLVIIPDADFTALMSTAVPVQARIRLTGGKTTDKWRNPETGKEESGNLWYEEYLPSDCLFLSVIGERRSRTGNGPTGSREAGLADLAEVREAFQVVQLGGNETVGYGLSLLSLRAEKDGGAE
jgi:CRISPR-associated protein Cmr4